MKEWFRLLFKTFINDCSVGLFLISLGFLGGLCFNTLLRLSITLLNRF